MNPIDRVVKEHSVIAGPVLRVLRWFVSDRDVPPDQEFAMKAVDLFSAAGPQRNVIDADRLVAVCQLPSSTGRLNSNVTVRVDITRHVIHRLALHVQSREAAIPEPAEQRVVERDGVVIVQHRELDVTNATPPHRASSRPDYYAM